ncbi:mannonate dehydratase [Paenibacillus sp. HN-1]|uniref:mannonate dehydratase n=1 Tax=Paenibacillus TaxID=44249 RepID=UPI001CA9FFF0|nr:MULTISPECIES: mannonate dehydratase [Paenibacillus]MBY9078246.1 mannonate dehydratase [Paenibacillus sp. CGMCC 1.18879]MBY9086095.1 mannonate dehydratase [Paenibacillus sinensis]
MQLAEAYFFHDDPCDFWSLALQLGIHDAVISLHEQPGYRLTEYAFLAQIQKKYADHGLNVKVIESMPPSDRIKFGLPGRDEEIEGFKELILNMGELGIPVLCYNFMAGFGWFRTSTEMQTRGGALVSGYDHEDMRDAPLTEYGIVTEDQLWDNLKYFMEQIVTVAEKAGVKLALHPDDPPVSPIRGIARILRSADALQRAIDLVPSPNNGITLCQGTLAAAGEDIPGAIRRFGEQNKIFFVHFRDVSGTVERFHETFHDNGKTDMYEAMKTYKNVGYNGPIRADHVPTMAGEPNVNSGYEVLGRLFGNGYIIGLMEAVGYTHTKR